MTHSKTHPHDNQRPTADVLADALDELSARPRDCAEPAGTMRVAEVVDDRHPALHGRVQVAERDLPLRWIPTLMGLSVRRGDRVLLTHPVGSSEPVVVGVLCGYHPRVPLAKGKRAIELRADESVVIQTTDGRPLLEIESSDQGPILRLASPDLTLDVPGTFRLSAAAIDLRADEGMVKVQARDDVQIQGEVIHLN